MIWDFFSGTNGGQPDLVVRVPPLSVVELAMAIEETFEITITDEADEAFWTIGGIKDFVASQARRRPSTRCETQRTFYRLREAVSRVLSVPRSAVRPGTPWTELLPQRGRIRAWWRVARAARVPHLRRWRLPSYRRTVGSVAALLAAAQVTPRSRTGSGWSRDEVRRIVDGLVIEVCELADFCDNVALVD